MQSPEIVRDKKRRRRANLQGGLVLTQKVNVECVAKRIHPSICTAGHVNLGRDGEAEFGQRSLGKSDMRNIQ